MALVAALIAVLAAAGILLLIGGAMGFEFENRLATVEVSMDRAVQIVAGAVVALLVMVVTGWPVMSGFCSLAAAGAPVLWRKRRQRRRYVQRLDALADWVESVRDALAAASGLEQALAISAERPSEAIAEEVHQLKLNLRHRPSIDCLREFARDLAMPASDRIVASLSLAISSGSGQLVPVLTEVSRSARREAATARSIDSGRGELYSQANTISVIVGFVIVGSIVFRGDDMVAYSSFTGQIAQLLILTFLFGGVMLFHLLALPAEAERPLKGIGEGPNEADERSPADAMTVSQDRLSSGVDG